MLSLLVPTPRAAETDPIATDPGALTLLFRVARSSPGKALASMLRNHAKATVDGQAMSSSSAIPYRLP